MKTFAKVLILIPICALLGCIVVPSAVVEPQPEPLAPEPAPPTLVYIAPPPQVAGIYYNDLAPYGRWFIHPRYGRVWTPAYVPNRWQPYTVGHWVYTDDSNCTWVSDDPETQWGGIVYHYGQWVFTPDYGWCWVPGTVWAPAWVAWREGGGYCGWAPLPPECADQKVISYQDADRFCPISQFVFVDERTFDQPRVNQRIVQNNVTIINRTTNITNVTVVNDRIVNNGVSQANVERYTGRQMARVRTVDVSSPEEARRLSAAGQPVHFDNSAIEHGREQKARQDQQRALLLHQQVVDQREENQRVRAQDEATKQQATAARQQLEQTDRQAKLEQDRQAQLQREADRQKQAEDARQAALARQQAQQQEAEARRQAADQAEQDRKQAAEAARRQTQQDRAVARPSQSAPDQPADPNAPQGEPGKKKKKIQPPPQL